MANFKCPKKIIFQIIPKTSTGKNSKIPIKRNSKRALKE